MDTILADEKLIKKLHPSRWYFWQLYLAGGLFLAAALSLSSLEPWLNFALEEIGAPAISGWLNFSLFALGIGAVALVELLRRIHTFYITDKRITEGFTFLSRRIVSAHYSQIQNVNLIQSLPARIVNIGNLEFQTAGWGQTDRPEIHFFGVKEPMLLKNIISEAKLKISANG